MQKLFYSFHDFLTQIKKIISYIMDSYFFIYMGLLLAVVLTFMGGFQDIYVKDKHLYVSKTHYWSDAKFILLVLIVFLLVSIDKQLQK